jgi:hypothetical protein
MQLCDSMNNLAVLSFSLSHALEGRPGLTRVWICSHPIGDYVVAYHSILTTKRDSVSVLYY